MTHERPQCLNFQPDRTLKYPTMKCNKSNINIYKTIGTAPFLLHFSKTDSMSKREREREKSRSFCLARPTWICFLISIFPSSFFHSRNSGISLRQSLDFTILFRRSSYLTISAALGVNRVLFEDEPQYISITVNLFSFKNNIYSTALSTSLFHHSARLRCAKRIVRE